VAPWQSPFHPFGRFGARSVYTIRKLKGGKWVEDQNFQAKKNQGYVQNLAIIDINRTIGKFFTLSIGKVNFT
jgi:hypothetical protein